MSLSLNQQLAWSNQLLASFADRELPWQREALTQSLVWHLKLAYAALLAEHAAQQKIPLTSPPSADSLKAAVPPGRACPAELEELVQLEQSPGNWLSGLLAQPDQPARFLAPPPTDLIAATGGALTLNQACECLRALQEHAERIRALGVEY